MAQLSSFKALAIFLIAVILSATALARDLEMAPAPAPSMDTGSAYSLPISGAIVCSSVVLSLLVLLKH